MKIIERLNQLEFDEYCNSITNNMESETCYFGQIDEDVPFYDIKRRHIYGDEKNEHEVVLYDTEYDDENDTVIYLIYDTID